MSGRLSTESSFGVKAKVVATLAAVTAGGGAAAGVVLTGSASAAPPAPPAIKAGPSATSYASTAFFTFSESRRVTFTCRLDSGAWTQCGDDTTEGTASYGHLSPGFHVFFVYASSNAGLSTAASYSWTYVQKPPPGSHTNGRTSGRHGHGRPNRTRAPSLGSTQGGGSNLPQGSPSTVPPGGPGTTGRHSGDGPPGSSTGSPPTAGIVFPAENGLYTKAGAVSWQTWDGGCAAPGFCGVVIDGARPVADVSVSLSRTATGSCWDGTSSFDEACPHWVAADGTSQWHTSFGIDAFPVDGAYVLRVRATDTDGRSGDASAAFTIDRTPPPAPTFGRVDVSGDHASFELADAEDGVSFRCSLDGGADAACDSPVDYEHLAAGSRRLCVTAVDAAGNPSASTCYAWTVGGDTTGGGSTASFQISGSPLGGVRLYPGGPAVPVELVLTNPGGGDLTVDGVTMTVAGTGAAGCSASSFTVVQNLLVSPVAVVVPAGETKSLEQLGVPESQWPELRMVDTGGSQDACKGTNVRLSFSGSGSTP
jgi:hypothetical protein